MILIADSGSTKTDWRIIDRENQIHQFSTIGMHPFFVSDEEMVAAMKQSFLGEFQAALIRTVYFYGSGLSSAREVERFTELFQGVFQLAKIEVHHDLLGAARAVCGNSSGIAMILGTGANTCTYAQGEILENISSTGFILGDEGSGADLGKRWVHAYITEAAPEHLREAFYRAYGANKELILERVYKGERPNRFLASFCPFLKEHIDDPFIQKLVSQAFEDLIQNYLLRYEIEPGWKVHATGSIAFIFSNVLTACLERNGLSMGNLVQKPISALALYHFPR